MSYEQIELKLRPDQKKWLTRAAKREGLTRSALLRRWIEYDRVVTHVASVHDGKAPPVPRRSTP